METSGLDYKTELPRAAQGLTSEEMERYVRAFERAPERLRQGCSDCALGALAGTHDVSEGDLARYLHMRAVAEGSRGTGRPSPYQVVEDVFERFSVRNDHPDFDYWSRLPDDPRLAIYEAFVEELARRASKEVEPPTRPMLAARHTTGEGESDG